MVLLLRVWMDGPRRDQLRVRLTSSRDNVNTEQPLAAATGVDQVVDEVRTCLEEFCAEAGVEGDLPAPA
jgi:hypothetical protein